MPNLKTGLSLSPGQYCGLQRAIVLPSPEELFDHVVERLRIQLDGSGVFTYADVAPFRRMISSLTNQLFLLVPPPPKGLLDDQILFDRIVSLIDVDGRRGKNSLDPRSFANLVMTPQAMTLLRGVEDGADRRNVHPSVSRYRIMSEKRHPYTIWQGIIHAIVFPEVFASHGIELLGSRCGLLGSVCGLSLDGDRHPSLCGEWNSDQAHPDWGAPSYACAMFGA